MKITGRLSFIENGTTQTSPEYEWRGGKGKFFVEATWQTGSSIKLQFQSPHGTWIDYPNASFTANGMVDIELPPCRVRVVAAQVLATAQVISGITKANPAVVTYVGADTYANGDRVYISGVVGMVEVNGLEFIVAGVNTGANTFQLSGINSTGYTTYVSDGTVEEVSRASAAYVYAIGSHQ